MTTDSEKISVIIPTYNEAECIGRTIRAVENRGGRHIREVIVVDGDSKDETRAIAKNTLARVLRAPEAGRALQLNYGAKQATGEVLYFLHGDTLPPEGFAADILRALEEGTTAGSFRLAFDDESWLLDFFAFFTRFNVSAVRFGDQSLFSTAEGFKRVDGFDNDHVVMEGNDMARRLKQVGSFRVRQKEVITSAAKYRRVGIVKLQLVFTLIYVLYFCGVSQKWLGKIYRRFV